MITLSVVLYNTKIAVLSPLLDSCVNASHSLSTVLFVDNSPLAELREVIERRGFLYLHRPDNPGFGASHNFAFSKVAGKSQFHFIVNPDVQFDLNGLSAMVEYMKSRSDVGLVAPRVINPDGTIQFNRTLLPTPANMLIRRFLEKTRIGEKLNYRFQLRHLKDDEVIEIPAATGCFMLVRSSIFQEIGGFDERFFLYFEDYDLTRRIAKVARTMYFPMATVVHEHARGAHKFNRLFIAMVISALRYFNKWGWIFDNERSALNNNALPH